ncbi:MAG: SDR family oxidoreductase [Bacillota bacterium]|nr:SDR family oxidoreductase [Bacillota bacterium]
MNKTVLITGASSGIGLEFSKLFVRNGYNLIMVSQNEKNLEKAKRLVCMENDNAKIYAIAKNLAEPSAADEIFEYTKKNSIQIDVLVNNAGIQVYGKFYENKMDDLINLMYVNMVALTKLTRLFIDGMVKRREGKILNVASTGAFQPCPMNAAYCASKGYVLYLSEGMGAELKGTGVTVTALCPGATKTNFAKRANIEDIKLFRGRLLDPNRVAEIGYEALIKGESVVVTGLYNKLVAESVRFMPRKLVTKIGMNVMGR